MRGLNRCRCTQVIHPIPCVYALACPNPMATVPPKAKLLVSVYEGMPPLSSASPLTAPLQPAAEPLVHERAARDEETARDMPEGSSWTGAAPSFAASASRRPERVATSEAAEVASAMHADGDVDVQPAPRPLSVDALDAHATAAIGRD